MRFVCYQYDIPDDVLPKDYPEPSAVLRSFATRVQMSVWILPLSALSRTEDLTAEIRGLGGTVDAFQYDEMEADKIRIKARTCLTRDASHIRAYVEASVVTTREKLVEAETMVSINDVNAAIRFQQTALNRALREIGDIEACAAAFELTTDLAELNRSVRSVIDARATAFATEKTRARAVVKASAATTVTFGESGSVDPRQTNLPGVGG
jgi:hypothetical protein